MNPPDLFRFCKEFKRVRLRSRPQRMAQRNLQTRHTRHAFTLVELLVVIAIVAILISLIMVGIGRANQAGRATVCRGNLRAIALAANTYSSSNKSRTPSPRTDTPAGWTNLKTSPPFDTKAVTREDASNSYIGWVRTESSLMNSIKTNSSGEQYETDVALQNGSLYNYIGVENAYKSPQDPTARVRSYSLNSFVGVMYCNDFYTLPGQISTAPYTFDTRTMASISKPAQTLFALPEWNQTNGALGWNANGYLGNPEITVNPTTGTYTNATWYGAPAVWNPGFINMAYVDGSVDTYAIQSPEMKNGDLQSQFSGGNYPNLPDTNVDQYNIKMMLLPGKIK